MIDKEKLKKELIRLKDKYYKRGEESAALQDSYAMYWGGVVSTFNEIITLVDSLPEEPTSEDLKEEIDKYISEHFFGSETLEFFSVRSKEEPNCIDIDEAAKHFANWQKEQTINKACEWLSKEISNYVSYDGEIDKQELLGDFRKAMEEQL